MGKVIHWEMCKKLKFDHMNKWYMHNPESILENVTHKLHRDFEIHTDHLTSARRPDLIIIYKQKRTRRIVDFIVPTDHRVKLNKSEKKNKYLDFARELKKLWNMKVTVIPIVNGALSSNQRNGSGTGGLGNKRTSADHLNYIIIKIGQNTEKSPWDL